MALKMKRFTTAVYAFALILCFEYGSLLIGATQAKINPTSPSADRALSNPTEIEDFSNSFFARAMPQLHIPGAAFVLVKDGKVIFMKGYGYADLEKHIRVVPDRTVFRVASVSKVFTATAVLQLAERGQLDLHANVNRYLKAFKVRDPYPQSVTSAELLTHSAGLDDSVFNLAARRPSGVVPLGAFLANQMPPVMMPPGKIYSYSSFGIALEGYLVQEISGEPFDDYIGKNILQPLEMQRSGFRLTPELDANLATGYEYHHGRYTAQPIDYFNIPPAVGLYSTVSDMAHFLIAQMEGGKYGEKRILSDAFIQEMHRRQFAEDPRLAGRTYGFYERYVNGQRAIGHGGNIRGFASLLMLVPRDHVGFFLVFNRDESRFEGDFIHSFFDRFYPETNNVPDEPMRLSAADSQKFTGSYRSNPYSRRTFEKLITLYWQFHITANPDGTLEFHYPHHFKPPERWLAMAPNYFVTNGGQGHAVFEVNSAGRVVHLFTDRNSYEKVPWYGTATFQIALVKALMLILLSGCVWWPVHALVRWLRKKPNTTAAGLRWARSTAAALAILNVFFIVELLHLLNGMDDWNFVYGVPAGIKALLWIPIITTVLASVVVWYAFRIWKDRWGPMCGRVHYSVIAGAAVMFVWFFVYWNLLGFLY